MVKLENVLGGSVQFHFNIAEKLHKIVVIAEGITTVYDEDEVLAMLKVWNHLGEALESDKMAVDLVNGFMTKFGEEARLTWNILTAHVICDAMSELVS